VPLRFSPTRRISIVAGAAWRLRRSSSRPEGDQHFARRGFAGACQEVWPIIWKRRYALCLAFVLVLVGRVMGFAFPLASKFLVDDVLVRQDWTKLAPVVGWVAAGALISIGSSFAAAVVLDLVEQHAVAEYQSPGSPTAMPRSWANAAFASAVGSASGSRLRGRFSPIRRC